MGEIQICRQCILHSQVPGVTINENGFCNECVDYDKVQTQSEVEVAESSKQDTELTQKMEELFAKVKEQRNWYDAMLLFSGGKDSTYLLDLAINKYHLKVITFTTVLPIGKKQAGQNIDDTAKVLNVDVMKLAPEENMYKKLMKYGLMEGHNYDMGEMAGCHTCSFLFRWLSFKLAMKMKIPIILDGRDKAQSGPIFITGEAFREGIAKGEKPFGKMHDLFRDATGEEYLGTIYDYNEAELASENLPALVAPFTFLNYDYRKNFGEFEKLGLNSANFNSMFTNCDGVYLFDYIALKKFDCTSYVRNYASGIRKEQPTITQLSLDQSETAATSLSRQTMLAVMEEYKQLLYYVAAKKLTHANVTQADKDKMLAMVTAGHQVYDDQVLGMMMDRFLTVNEFANYFEINLLEMVG